MMQLIIHRASPNCVAVLAAIRLLELGVELRELDLFNDEQRAPEFLRTNPNGLVPVLLDGDFVVWETVAILQYLAGCDPTQRLLSREERRRADVTRWMAWGLAHWNPALQPFIFERLFKPMKGLGVPDEERLARLEPTLKQTAGILDSHLSKSPFVGGDHLSVADLHLAAYPMYGMSARINLEGFSHLGRWLAKVHGLSEWRAAAGVYAE